VISDVDGHDSDALIEAVTAAQAATDKPTLICCKTTIGFGSPNKGGKETSHGSPLGDDEIQLARKTLGWAHEPFDIPQDIYTAWDAKAIGAQKEATWQTRMDAYKSAHTALAEEFERRMNGELPADWDRSAAAFIASVDKNAETIASRKASLNSLNGYGPMLPELLGGSADLAGSNLTIWNGSKGIQDEANGNYIYFGVREFGMTAIINGLSLYGGFKPYGATFLMFSEYSRNALRMAALMKLPNIQIFTHDSIGLGEDGPTHQPVEQTATLRLMPNMSVWRPCDAVESAVAWRCAVERSTGPTSLIFSRQGLAHQTRDAQQINDIANGGYVLQDTEGEPDAIIIATGSEVQLAVDAAKLLGDAGTKTRVVSMPSTDTFDAQTDAYKSQVLPDSVTARVAIEAGVGDLWRKYVGLKGDVMSIDTFGESGPAADVFAHFGFTAENLAAKVKATL